MRIIFLSDYEAVSLYKIAILEIPKPMTPVQGIISLWR